MILQFFILLNPGILSDSSLMEGIGNDDEKLQ